MYNMRKYLLHILIISFIFLLAPTVSFADADRIFKLNSKAVVMVIKYDEKGNEIGSGSGFIVRRDGAVVTNYHVIGMAKDIKVKAGDKVFDVEGLIYTDKENDLAILKARAKDLPVVKLGVIGEANIGEHVYVIGNPSGLENTISVGLLRGIRKIDEKREILRTTTPVSPGSSGSPVFNRNGEVIGVATMSSISETRNSSVAISVKLIKDRISSKNITAIKESGLEDYINTAMYWNNLGCTYFKSGKYEEAIKSFKQAIEIDPDFAEVHYNLGLAYFESGKYEEAIDAYKHAIRIDPDAADAHYNLGTDYGKSGMYKEAIESFKQAVRIDPDYASAHHNLGVAYRKTGRNEEEVESYKQAIRIDPDLAIAHYNLGVAYGNLGKYKKAKESFKQAIRIDPDYKSAHYNLGITYLQINDRGSAIEQYKILKKLDTEMANELFNHIY
jgi:Tfp pilus assembly protein PilF